MTIKYGYLPETPIGTKYVYTKPKPAPDEPPAAPAAPIAGGQ